MNIGILTFQSSNNFGAILQAYALQQSIEKLGGTCIIINYISPTKSGWYKAVDFSTKKSLKHNIKQIFKLPNLAYINKKNRQINAFKSNNLKIANEIFIGSTDELSSYFNTFDVVVVGSDQVWNFNNTSFDKTYFLDFEKNTFKKTSYAASFGMDSIPEDVKGEYKRLLSSFSAISVREDSGRGIISNLTNIEPAVSLDPTLLLDDNDWKRLVPTLQKKIIKESYLLIYTIGRDKNIEDIAQYVSKQMNLKIVRIMKDFRDEFSSYKNVNPSIEEFLSLFYNAEYVLTNSFHGVAFSINFKKEFFVYLNPNNKANTRIENILKITELGDRLVSSGKQVLEKNKISYPRVISLLDIERQKSIRYIENNIIERKEDINA